MPDYLIATGKVPLIAPPGTTPAAMMAAALAAVPDLVVPPKVAFDARCKTALGDQLPVNTSLGEAEKYVEGLAGKAVAQPGSTAVR